MEDRQRFARFVEEHMAVVYASAYGATGDRALSEEIAQETFLCAWRKLPGLDRPPVMPAWLCGIARGMARNVRRRRGRELPLLDHPIAADAPSPLDSLLVRERASLVRRALARVPRRYREPLVLYYQGEESVQSVADALGLTSSAVRQRLSRGRKHLRDEVDVVERELRRERPRPGLAAAIAAALTPITVARAAVLPGLLSFAPAAAVCGLLGSFSVPPPVASDPVAILVPDPDPDPVPDPVPDPDPDPDPDPVLAPDPVSPPVLDFTPDPIARPPLPVPGSRSPVSLSLSLSSLSPSGPPVSDSIADRDFATARELQRRGYPNGALSRFEAVVRRGPTGPHYREALASVAQIARTLPDPTAAGALLAAVPAADLPAAPRLRGDIDYLLGRHHYATDTRLALAHLDAVATDSPRYLDARLLAGVIHVRLGRAAAAARAFQSVVDLARDPARRARFPSAELAAARDRALLDLGRLHYSTRRYQRALEAFGRVPRRSPEWPTALFESTWAYFRAGDAARGLGHLHSLKAPHFAGAPFPEALKVEAIFYFQGCHFRRAERVTRDFERRYGPVLREIERIAASRRGDQAGFLATARSLRAAASPARASPASAAAAPPPTVELATRQLAAAALADREVQRSLAAVAELDRELRRLARADAAWRTTAVGVALLQDLTVQRDLAAETAGRLARARLERLAGELRALQGDMRRIRIEILGIRADHVGRTLPAEPEPRVYAIDDQNSYWPFDGEFWRDELGRYYVDIKPVCRR